MIVVADTGPVLHLHWVGAASWALPPRPIHVVQEVWIEVDRHAPDALSDARFVLVRDPVPVSPLVLSSSLDAGEQAALSYALSNRAEPRERGKAITARCTEATATQGTATEKAGQNTPLAR